MHQEGLLGHLQRLEQLTAHEPSALLTMTPAEVRSIRWRATALMDSIGPHLLRLIDQKSHVREAHDKWPKDESQKYAEEVAVAIGYDVGRCRQLLQEIVAGYSNISFSKQANIIRIKCHHRRATLWLRDIADTL